ncbi:hypothetical protein AB0A74_30970 [Saccharothrix sp. NPDC042600]|uniref:hypothetical protein n=1 Tax=Saccharothrix TaxID=2071 RepID=UPI0033DAEEC7|nr:hypothetical protein GCM10017745_54970 [Saccharothrix mutabilis subsp. capreolus]
MKRFATALLGALTATALTVPFSPAAHAAVGEVVVYIAEVEELVTFENPRGCYEIPVGAHVMTNRTNKQVEVFGVPNCGDPFPTPPIWVLQENYGGHVPPAAASFKVP